MMAHPWPSIAVVIEIVLTETYVADRLSYEERAAAAGVTLERSADPAIVDLIQLLDEPEMS
jgi:hypothetical protein